MDNPIISLNHLTKIFIPPLSGLWRQLKRVTESGVVALNDVSLDIYPGDIFGLVGRNGQGKTTLIKTLATLIMPTCGEVKIFGLDASRHAQEIKGRVGMVSADEHSFYGRLSSRQNLLFFARLCGLSERLASRRIGELTDMFEFGSMLNRRFHELSSGNKQRLAIMRAMLLDPPLLLLDEPTRSLDPMSADELRKIIRERMNQEQKRTILITSHNLQEIETLCNRVGFLSRGCLKLCATMHELRTRYYGREQVTITASGVSATNGLGELKNKVPCLVMENMAEGQLKVQFTRQSGDDSLNTILTGLIQHGAWILSCSANCDVLKDILTGIEK